RIGVAATGLDAVRPLLEGGVAVYVARLPVGRRIRQAASQRSLARVGARLSGTEAGSPVGNVLRGDRCVRLALGRLERLFGVVEALLRHGREGAGLRDVQREARQCNEGGGSYGEASGHSGFPPLSVNSPWTGTVVPPWMTDWRGQGTKHEWCQKYQQNPGRNRLGSRKLHCRAAESCRFAPAYTPEGWTLVPSADLCSEPPSPSTAAPHGR